ncbi:hypothetical protein [Streptomyces sp. ISL-98]|uniref:hypothetical protein n=1 Tax=Streptomyces sp. ISL-98 TaxID=2819192 RepID=UPI001BE4E338|nr:hypothetical protein [Streptomyces sp. ISL-98]
MHGAPGQHRLSPGANRLVTSAIASEDRTEALAVQLASTHALLAIAYAVLETGYDIDNVRSAIESA